MTEEGYAGLHGLRASWLKTLYSQTPAHLRARMLEPMDSDALRFGRALHTAVLQPELYEGSWAVAPKVDKRTTAGKELWARFEAECAASGKGVLTEAEGNMVQGIMRSLAGTTASEVLSIAPMREVVMTGQIGGVECKCRIDACSMDGLLVDLKTTVSAAPRAFTRSVVEYGYLLQLAFYRTLMQQNGIGYGATVLVAVEKQAPFAAALYALRDDDINRMMLILPELAQLYKHCIEDERWPAYPSHVQMLTMPEWAFKNEEEVTL